MVVVRTEADGRATAEAVGIPEIRATAATREEAIQQVRQTLTEWLATGQLVRVQVAPENSLLEVAGWVKNDPLYAEFLEELQRARREDLRRQWEERAKSDPEYNLYLEEIRRHRQEMDESLQEEEVARECSNTPSTPTT
jgi:hypothetical protein